MVFPLIEGKVSVSLTSMRRSFYFMGQYLFSNILLKERAKKTEMIENRTKIRIFYFSLRFYRDASHPQGDNWHWLT